MRDTVLKVRSCSIAILSMRLNAPLAFGAAHVLATKRKRILNADERPATVAVAHPTFITNFFHADLYRTRAGLIQLAFWRRKKSEAISHY